MALAAMQRSAACRPGLTLLRRDVSTARGSPGRFAAVALARRRCSSDVGSPDGPDQTTLFRALRGLASRPWRRATPRGAEKNEVGLPPTLFATPSPRLGEQVSKARSLRRVQAHSTRKHSALARRGSSHTARAARAQQTHKGSLSQQGERRYRTRAAAPHTAENAARR